MSATKQLLSFCAALEQRRARYEVRVEHQDAVMVSVAVPGEWWEIEFFEDGHVELERFVSQGVEERSTAVGDVLRFFDE